MNLKENVSRALAGAAGLVTGAAGYVQEKNRQAAYINRIRAVIRCEEKASEREYLALGRYFYNNLRESGNSVTEAHCKELDAIEERMGKALNQLEEFYRAQEKAAEEASAEQAEEITLEDVESFDHDPIEAPAEEPAETPTEEPAETPVEAPVEMPVEAPAEEPAEVPEEAPAEAPVEAPAVPLDEPAQDGENDGLPFEG